MLSLVCDTMYDAGFRSILVCAKVFPVWASHWSLYTSSYTSLANGNEELLDDGSPGRRKEVREDVRKAPLALVDVVAEACHLLYHPSVRKTVNERVRISTERVDDTMVEEVMEEVVPAFWSAEAFSPSSSTSDASAEQTCQGRVAFIARGPAPLYHLALEAQVITYLLWNLCMNASDMLLQYRCVERKVW